ncbi:hypothetical protein ZHAS_00008445 [Anopheles sinensis]|uniref:Uncharacterized protein n=1 Tax=Anopheles sinensis TaxID=74873 RepID=A0A084VSH0_ANOSI|nr:hypothetical protein ZHAS_00008445 [Anopheles sinensis]
MDVYLRYSWGHLCLYRLDKDTDQCRSEPARKSTDSHADANGGGNIGQKVPSSSFRG